jgi:predicted aldo/keto reductase-like oxidoreductase
MSLSRREFIEAAALGSVAASASAAEIDRSTPVPSRILGRTGARVSILAFGCGSRFLMYENEDKALEALNHALDLGITYVDTAYGYGNGRSETRVGKVMKTRRNGVFLVTKCNVRDGDAASRMIEGSLKRLQTDHLDLIHIHGLTDEDDLTAIEANDGVLNVLLKLRDQKVTRFIGITSHTDPTVLRTALERHDFDCTQMALNAAMAAMKSGSGGNMAINTAMKTSFETVALPVAAKKNLGVIAMKVFAQGNLEGQAPVAKLIQYSLSLPGVKVAVAGMPKLEYLEENVRIAKAYQPMPPAEMHDLSHTLSSKNKEALDRFFSNHVDA